MNSKIQSRLRVLYSKDRPRGLEELRELCSSSSFENDLPGPGRQSTPARKDLDDVDKGICDEARRIESVENEAKLDDTGMPTMRKNLLDTAIEFCKEHPMDGFSSKVFVGNISFKVKNRELKEFFSYFGKVLRADVLTERGTKSFGGRKRSRG